MDSTEFNKIAGAGLLALLVFLLLNFFSGAIYGTRGAGEHHGEEQVLAYALAVEEAGGEQAEEPQIDLAALVAEADPAAGEGAFRACTACHKIEEGANAVGPHLHGVVGRDIASVEGFAYSDALVAAEGDWTLEHMMGFLENPKGWAPGTKMSFAGIKDPQDRVDVIAYLNEAGGSPIDLAAGLEPAAAAGETATDAAADAAGETAGETTGETTGDAAEAQAPAAAEGSVAEGEEAGGAQTGQATVDTAEADAPSSPAAETHEAKPAGEDAVAVTDPTPQAPAQEEPAAAGAPGEGAEPAAGAPEAEGADQDAATPGGAAPAERVEGADAPPQSPPGEAQQTDPQQQLQADQGEAAASGEQAPAAEGQQEQLAAAPAAGEGTAGGAAGGFAGGDAAAGEKVFRRCAACHSVEEGKSGVGPSLHGVVGRDIGGLEGYSYSDAMAAHEGEWTAENLSTYLENPKAMVPGTKMAFPGLKNEQDRVNVITYLNEADGSPAPLE
jgi:cytochrome c2